MISIYSFQSDAFQATEVDILEQLTEDLEYELSLMQIKKQQPQIKADLQAAEENLEKFMRGCPDGICILDSQTHKLLELNDRFAQITGEAHDAILGKTLDEVAFFKKLGGSSAWINGSVSEGQVADRGICWTDTSEQHWAGVLTAQPIRWEKKDCILCVLSGTVQQPPMEKQVDSLQDRCHLLVENLTESVWFLDQGFLINYVNSAVKHSLGYDPEGLIGVRIADLLDEKSWELLQSMALAGTRPRTEEPNAGIPAVLTLTFLAQNGSQKQFEATLHTFPRLDGDIDLWLCVAADVTERYELESALRASEQRWQFALDSSGDGIWDWNIADGNLCISPKVYDILGYSALERQQNISDWMNSIHPEDMPALWHQAEKALSGEVDEFSIEGRIRRQDGVYLWVLWRGKVLQRDINGDPLRLIGTISNISSRKFIAEALENSDMQFRLLAERSTDMICRTNAAGEILYASPACEKITGYTPDEIRQVKLSDLIHPEDHALVDFVAERLPIYREIKPLRFRIRRKDEEYTWVETTASTVCEPQTGRINEIQATIRDISDRVIAEDGMRETEEKFRALISQSVDGVVLVDEEGKIVEWSKGQEKLSGHPRAEVTDKYSWDVYMNSLPPEKQTPEKLEQTKDKINTLLLGGNYPAGSYSVEHVIERQDGSRVIAQSVIFPIRTQHGYMMGAISRDITAIRVAEDALKESEERLRFITDNMIDVVCYIDKNRNIQFISQSVEQSLGYQPQELSEQSLDDFIHPQDAGMLHQAISAGILRRQAGITLEYRIRNAAGAYQWMESLIHLIFNEDGTYRGAVLGSRDITEKKSAADALKESEERYRTLAKNFPNGMVMLFDRDYRFSIADGIGLSLFGFRHPQLEGHTLVEVFPSEVAEVLLPSYSAVFEGIPNSIEITFAGRDLQIYTLPLFDNEKNITGGMMMTQDITDRKNAVEALSDRAQFLSSLNEITRIALETSNSDQLLQKMADLLVLMFAADDCFITDWEEETGTTTPLVASGSMQDVFHTIAISPEAQTLTRTVLDLGHAVAVSDLANTPFFSSSLDAQFPLKSILALPLIGGSKKIGSVLIGYQRTHEFEEEEIHRAEQVSAQIALGLYKQQLLDEIWQSNQQLEKRVAERTADLETKNSELESFTYSVSHDLKVPLRGIEGYSRLLIEDHQAQLDPEGIEFLTTIRQATNQMSQLIEDLLAYSRLERRALMKARVDICQLVNNILRERQVDIQQKEIEVILETTACVVTIDERALEQAIRNLIDNAIKFTFPERKPVIQIRLKSEGEKYILSVQDNGIGFDMKYQEKIFDIFQRLHIADDYPGTGIGLALVKKAMQRIGGRSWAVSEPGQGSTFYLEFSGEPDNE